MRRLLVLCLLLVAAAPLWWLVVASPAQAQASGFEHISDYAIDIFVRANGTIEVEETIVYDFGPLLRHGIYRDIYTSQDYDPSLDDDPRVAGLDRSLKWSRRYPLDVESVDSPTAPDKYAIEDPQRSSGADTFSVKRLKIGDKDKTITGKHTYVIRYSQRGVVNALPGDDEFYWNVVGFEWDVPIRRTVVTVRAETGAIPAVSCFAGLQGSTSRCVDAAIDGGEARFTDSSLGEGRGLTVVASILDDNGDAVEPEKIVREKWSLKRAFDVTPATVAGGVAVALGAGAGIGTLAFRRGRDRRAIGGATDIAFAGEAAASEPVGLFEKYGTPVEFVPPDGIRPGQLGLLIDETADTVDVSATIVDLAVRGYLRIEEVTNGRGKVTDHRLVRLDRSDGLLPYESRLLGYLFPSMFTVSLNSLKKTFAAEMAEVKQMLYVDAVNNGWFDRRPDQVRQKWTALGVLSLVACVAALVGAIAFTHAALVAAPLAIAGPAMLVVAKFMPRRTPKGTGAYRRALGFKDFIDNSEKYRAEFAERKNLFTEYLPFAIMFGCVDRWAKTFESLGVQPDVGSWYVGTAPFSYSTFGRSVNSFSSSASSVLTSTPGSSGSSSGGGGFSGGGGGGGGGGSW